MEKEFIGYNEALALKELGFDEPCFIYWVFNNVKITFSTANNKSGWSMLGFRNSQMDKKAGLCTAPTYSQAFRWFREKYELTFYIEKPYHHKSDWRYVIDVNENEWLEESYKSYEEAELECLKKLIEIVKEKK